ncbi:pyridoxal phosphate-dependent aminotransferase [Sphingobium phenoxybenzoativorans]|uniref:Pyridoxal phosphate-dependent aminotransferase n=1 Tax=Sphingobium phenoxybenzoativorans TaxID=1592790 RepID=A0A975Q2A3_9SPHN|nr:pyridoxal phosphate-dependent aminotransferase [Sphingobium phenoxybenzoativorans]QUT06476.1 pyridoxal phosphate-dependent aminotransferase [Sphingobium phenoxybenzoativorans]
MSIAVLTEEARDDLLARGYSRRQLGRIGALLGAGAVLSQFSNPAQAQSQAAKALIGGTRIGANECWTGPLAPGAQAGAAIVAEGNRYNTAEAYTALMDAVSNVENVPVDRILAWAGSGPPLARTVLAFCSPERGVVTGDPTFETVWGMAAATKTKLSKVPLTADYRHDVKAMLAADPTASFFYICTPNNPTGTVTPLADVEWLVANKPAGSVVVVDEAYLHFSEAPSAVKLAVTRDDVLILRTFSKLFGMAGMRLGLTIGHPDLQKKLMMYDRAPDLSVTAVACGTASITQADLIKARRAEMIAVREETLAHLKKRKIAYIPGSEANMFMIDWKKLSPDEKHTKKMQNAFLAENVQIGRAWDIYPSVSRVSVGSKEDMQKFCAALDKILTA